MTSLALNHEDTYAIESAVRSAIEMVMNVFYRVNSQQSQEYHRSLTKKNIENQKLRAKVEVAERELKTLRRRVRNVEQSFGPSDNRLNQPVHIPHASPAGASSPHRLPGLIGDELPGTDQWEEFTALMLDQNMPTTEAAADLHDVLGSKAPSHQNNPIPGRTEAPGGALSTPPISSAPLVVKEEPLDAEAVYIKWEMCEQSLGERAEHLPPVEYAEGECGVRDEGGPSLPLSGGASVAMGSQGREHVNSSMWPTQNDMLGNHNKQQRRKQLTQQYSRRLKERIYSDPERLQAYRERERRRYHKRKVLIADLPAESQRLRREAWRAAATRYRARKTILQLDPIQLHHHPFQDMSPPGRSRGGSGPGRGAGGGDGVCS